MTGSSFYDADTGDTASLDTRPIRDYWAERRVVPAEDSRRIILTLCDAVDALAAQVAELEAGPGEAQRQRDLDAAVIAVKARMGVESAPANEIALRLPGHLRGLFWERAMDYYLADKKALLDAAEADGLIAAAERRALREAAKITNCLDDSDLLTDMADERERADRIGGAT